MSPVEIVAALEALGIRVRVVHGEIDLDGAATPPAELLEELHRQGAAVLAYLKECGERPVPVKVTDKRVSSSPAPAPTETRPLGSDVVDDFCGHRGDSRGPAHLPHECPIPSCRPIREWAGRDLPRNPRASPVNAAQIFMLTGSWPAEASIESPIVAMARELLRPTFP